MRLSNQVVNSDNFNYRHQLSKRPYRSHRVILGELLARQMLSGCQRGTFMIVQKIRVNAQQVSWLVLDDNSLPIKPITAFVRYLNHIEYSPNTVRTYVNHLKLYWEYLHSQQKAWQTVTLEDLAHFVAWLRQPHPKILLFNDCAANVQRQPATVNAILASLSSFYRYHHRLGNTTIQLTESQGRANTRYKSLLYHVHKRKPIQRRIIGLKSPKKIPKTLKVDQIKTLLSHCHHSRDCFLFMLLYETGLRIGQALSLKHSDIRSWDNQVHTVYRQHTPHMVQNKSRRSYVIHVSPELMALYSDYVNTLHAQRKRLNEYVFTNLSSNTPLTYASTRHFFERLSKKSGIKVTAHMLRHTHATELIKHGWDASFVQKRLGHQHVQTTLGTYTHIDQNDLKQAFKRFLEKKGSPC